MLIDSSTERFKVLFGHHPFQTAEFTSRLPPYETLVRCMVDPSVCGTGPNPIDQIEDIKQLFAQQVADVALGSQYMIYKNVVRQLGDTLNATTGVLKHLQPQVDLVMKSVAIGSSLLEADIEDALVDAAFGAGMKALGAAGPIGKIVAAVIGLGKMVWDIIAQREKIQKAAAAQREALAWAQMPPLQEPSAATDSYMANKDVIERMSSGSWTRIFAPRFEPYSMWVGLERKGGFAFAPGKTQEVKDLFGRSIQVFEPSNGVGLVPGFDYITSVIQVSLPYDSVPIRQWQADRSYSWPIQPRLVRDVGSYYVNTGRLAAIAWSWATEQDATPNLYKIDVGTPGSSRRDCLHSQWSAYYGNGLQYLREKTGDPKMLAGDNLEYVYGSGLACALASWECKLKTEESTTYRPKFLRINPGLPAVRMNDSISLHPYGCAVRPLYIQGMAEGRYCLVSLYESHIRATLEKVRERQVFYLRHSLVCAYAREGWDAFRDPAMRELLRKMRATLLKHPDRKLIDLDDVPDDEPFNGEDWKTQLIKAGVKKTPAGQFGLKVPVGTIEPSDEPAPSVPSWLDKMPFADYDTPPEEAPAAGPSLAHVGLVGGASLLGGWLAYRAWKRRKEQTWNR